MQISPKTQTQTSEGESIDHHHRHHHHSDDNVQIGNQDESNWCLDGHDSLNLIPHDKTIPISIPIPAFRRVQSFVGREQVIF